MSTDVDPAQKRKADLTALAKTVASNQTTLVAELTDAGALRSIPNVIKDLGIDREEKVRDRKIQAMTDPKAFYEERKMAVERMKNDVISAYKTTFKQHWDAGMSEKDASKHAEAAAAKVKAILDQGIKLEFGDDSEALAKAKQVNDSVASRALTPF